MTEGRDNRTLCKKSEGKCKFLYCAVSSTHDCSKRFTLYFPCRPVQSNTFSSPLGSSSLMLQLMGEDCSFTYPPLSIARYSFLQLSELKQRRCETFAQGFNTAAHDSNQGTLNREFEALPLSHCVLQYRPTKKTVATNPRSSFPPHDAVRCDAEYDKDDTS